MNKPEMKDLPEWEQNMFDLSKGIPRMVKKQRYDKNPMNLPESER